MPKGKNKGGCIVGLTGGMGCGKSTVLVMFRSKGAFTLDADAIVHQLLSKDRKVLSAVRRKFGAAVFQGRNNLDRKALARVVFASTNKKRMLERILHPLVRREISRSLAKNVGRVAVVDVPLLFESGMQNRFDKVVVVAAGLKRRLKRLKAKGFDGPDLRRRLKAQWPLEKKIRLADFVVNNNGPKPQTKRQIDQIWKRLMVDNDGGK